MKKSISRLMLVVCLVALLVPLTLTGAVGATGTPIADEGSPQTASRPTPPPGVKTPVVPPPMSDKVQVMDAPPPEVMELLKKSGKDPFQYSSTQDPQANVELSGVDLSRSSSLDFEEFYGKWAWFGSNQYEIDTIFGTIYPAYTVNFGDDFVTYHERELYLDRGGDRVEFISMPLDDGETWGIWVCVVDEGNYHTALPFFECTGTPPNSWAPYQYYVHMAGGFYYIGVWNSQLSQYHFISYDDRDNASYHIDWYTGSTELTLYDNPEYGFCDSTSIVDDYTYDVNDQYHTPQEAFDFWGYTDDQEYVLVLAFEEQGGKDSTYHLSVGP